MAPPPIRFVGRTDDDGVGSQQPHAVVGWLASGRAGFRLAGRAGDGLDEGPVGEAGRGLPDRLLPLPDGSARPEARQSVGAADVMAHPFQGALHRRDIGAEQAVSPAPSGREVARAVLDAVAHMAHEERVEVAYVVGFENLEVRRDDEGRPLQTRRHEEDAFGGSILFRDGDGVDSR